MASVGSGPIRTKPALKHRWRRRFLLLAVGSVLVLWLSWGWLLRGAAEFLDVSEVPTTADCVLILGGAPETRPFVAAALFKAGLARVILVPTIHRPPEVQDGLLPPEEEIIRRVLLTRGVPAEAILALPQEVNSTADEAHALAEYLDRQPGQTVTVVTTGMHTRRARWIFRRVLGNRVQQLHFVGAPTERFNASDWWRHEEGVRAYLNEYVKFGFYLLRY